MWKFSRVETVGRFIFRWKLSLKLDFKPKFRFIILAVALPRLYTMKFDKIMRISPTDSDES